MAYFFTDTKLSSCRTFLSFYLCCIICFSYVVLHTRFVGCIYGGRRGFDCMVVRFTATCAISVYQHYSCEFEFRSWRGALDTHDLIKFVIDLRYVGGFLRFFPPINATATI